MGRSRGSWFVSTLVAGLLICALVAPAVALTGPESSQFDRSVQTADSSVAATQDIDADRTEFRITVYDNGSAEWLFRYEQRLESDEDREDFETFAEEFNTEETDLYENFRDRAESLTEGGTDRTDREMSAEAFARDARVEELGPAGDEFGVVEMSFRWTAFGVTENDRVTVGDVFEGGLYLGENQRVVFQRGPSVVFESIQPEDGIPSGETVADSETVTWEGERSFTDNRPRVVLRTDEATPTPTQGNGSMPAESDPGWMFPAGALLVVVLLGLGAAFAYRTGVLSSGGGTNAGTAPGDDGSGGAETATPEGPTAGDTASAGPAAAVPDEELMSDEERVVSLLEENGGRMKQVKIVDETGWSKSKVSMLLSDMEDEGTISKLRVGRENIVSLSGHEPDAAGSPFEDE